MKKITNLIAFFGLIMVLVSCGPSVSVTDSWKAPDIAESKSDDFVVMARVDDVVGRQRFEQEIVKQLISRGVDAVESYKKYPDLNLNMKMTPDQIDELERKFRSEGINGIVLTVIKDMKTEINTTTSGGYAGGYYPYFGGYYGSYYSPYGYGGAYMPASSRTYQSDIYKLETVVFDLDRKGDQMVAVISVNITDPKSASEVAPKYAEKIAGQFDERKK
ncbi:hypothetical protein [Lutimonas zeaxanthinifaciens]|uniref:hypothetical protein n=1 Tax=Lutimonas zeaxanthinifaciens TaxID=3060215 RepID=UPI00265CD863|nr:hypothetical protein [Lutimonas sp. YSD2104]WKK65585.1 hypothetical protein QZH61_13470 [Lutimonas sp. YSD2104]